MDIDEIYAAHTILEDIAVRTPMLSKTPLDELVGGEIFLKCENLQVGGSFKLRGAYSQMARLTEEQRAGGVVTYSSGNHGIGVCIAGQRLGIDVLVYLPEDASASKKATIQALGGTVIEYDPATVLRETLVTQDIADGRTMISPYDHPHAIAGQGTVGAEIASQAPAVDTVLVPVGGGGLIAGIAVAIKSLMPHARVIGVEPAAADDTRQSIKAGHRVRISHPSTIADSLRTQMPGQLTFPLVQDLVDDVITVEDATIKRAMRDLFDHCNIVVEPGAAVGLAALYEGSINATGTRTCIVISGGNISTTDFTTLAST